MYFEEPGKSNTDRTLHAAFERGRDLLIDELVVASTSGKTAFKALEIFSGFRITAVTTHCGAKEPFKSAMEQGVKEELEAAGVRVITATHALSGVERSIDRKFSGVSPVLLIAETLRLFGQGTKVAVEVGIMATDAGALSGRDIIAVGGSSKGADTALVMRPAGQSHLFNMCIREIICKPRSF